MGELYTVHGKLLAFAMWSNSKVVFGRLSIKATRIMLFNSSCFDEAIAPTWLLILLKLKYTHTASRIPLLSLSGHRFRSFQFNYIAELVLGKWRHNSEIWCIVDYWLDVGQLEWHLAQMVLDSNVCYLSSLSIFFWYPTGS